MKKLTPSQRRIIRRWWLRAVKSIGRDPFACMGPLPGDVSIKQGFDLYIEDLKAIGAQVGLDYDKQSKRIWSAEDKQQVDKFLNPTTPDCGYLYMLKRQGLKAAELIERVRKENGL